MALHLNSSLFAIALRSVEELPLHRVHKRLPIKFANQDQRPAKSGSIYPCRWPCTSIRRYSPSPSDLSKNYPSIEFTRDCRLNSQIKISDLQNLVLYILADGPAPQFVAIRHRPPICRRITPPSSSQEIAD